MEINEFNMEDYNTFGAIVNDAVGYFDLDAETEIRCVTVCNKDELVGVGISCGLSYLYYKLMDGVFTPTVMEKDSNEQSISVLKETKEYTLSLFSDGVAITNVTTGVSKSLSFVDDFDGCIIYQLLDQNNNKRVSLTYSQKKVPSANDIRPYIFSQRLKNSDGIVIENLKNPRDVIAYQSLTVSDGLIERLSLNLAESNGVTDFLKRFRNDYENGFPDQTRYVRCFPKFDSSYSIHTPFWSVINKREYDELIKKSGMDLEVDHEVLEFYNGHLKEIEEDFLVVQLIDKNIKEEKIGCLVLKYDDDDE